MENVAVKLARPTMEYGLKMPFVHLYNCERHFYVAPYVLRDAPRAQCFQRLFVAPTKTLLAAHARGEAEVIGLS